MRDTTVPEQPCLRCGKLLNAAFHPDDFSPEPGDLSVCLKCGELHEYGANLELIKPSNERLLDMDLIDLQAVQRICALWHEHKGKQC